MKLPVQDKALSPMKHMSFHNPVRCQPSPSMVVAELVNDNTKSLSLSRRHSMVSDYPDRLKKRRPSKHVNL